LPPGRREAGREVFIAFECFTCHAVQGETFPAPAAGRDALGPALSGMGRLHPPEYLAEAIIDPNASVAWRIAHHGSSHEKYVATDGRSKMPTYNDVMTIQQLIDLVAYLSSLTSHGTEPQ
jgi:mono/diheme cytochrome c family protein